MYVADRREFRLAWWEAVVCLVGFSVGAWAWGYWVARSDAVAMQTLLRESAQTRCEATKGRTAYQNLRTGAVFCRTEQRFESVEPSKGDAL